MQRNKLKFILRKKLIIEKDSPFKIDTGVLTWNLLRIDRVDSCGWMVVGWVDDWFVGSVEYWVVGWVVDSLVGWIDDSLVGWVDDSLVGWVDGWVFGSVDDKAVDWDAVDGCVMFVDKVDVDFVVSSTGKVVTSLVVDGR